MQLLDSRPLLSACDSGCSSKSLVLPDVFLTASIIFERLAHSGLLLIIIIKGDLGISNLLLSIVVTLCLENDCVYTFRLR